MSKYTKEEVANAKANLIDLLNTTTSPIYGNVTHVAKSGMSRKIRFYVAKSDSIQDITWLMARALEQAVDDGGIKVSGCGMDMIFHTVHNLGYALGIDNLGNTRYERL